MLHAIERDGNKWEATGFIDDELMCVRMYAEDKRAIKSAGYQVDWARMEFALSEDIPVSLTEHNGRRRVAAVLKLGTEDDWIEVERKR